MSTEASTQPPPTDAERLSISRRLLLSSPPGQFDLILADLRNIHSSSSGIGKPDLLSDEWASEVRVEYESRTRRDVLLNGSSSSSAAAAVNARSGLVASTRGSMGRYMRERFPSYGGGQSSGEYSNRSNVSVDGTVDESEVIVTMYAERVDLRNYHAGSWSARYRFVRSGPSGDDGAAAAFFSAEGTVDIIAHTFENGNVQLRSSIPLGPVSVSAKSSSPDDLADAIASRIRLWEDDHVQLKLSAMYDSMNDGMLKGLRRVMPVTRTRMDWNLGGHRLVKTMADREKASK